MKKILLICAVAFLGTTTQAQKNLNVPAAVKTALASKYPNAKSVKWSKETDTEFEAEFKNGTQDLAANFDAKGKWVVTETAVKKEALPAAVSKSAAAAVSGYKTGVCEQVEKPGTAMYYEVKVEKGEHAFVLEISPDGKILKKAEEKEGKEEKDGKDEKKETKKAKN